jgi:hypothetical protein
MAGLVVWEGIGQVSARVSRGGSFSMCQLNLEEPLHIVLSLSKPRPARAYEGLSTLAGEEGVPYTIHQLYGRVRYA